MRDDAMIVACVIGWFVVVYGLIFGGIWLMVREYDRILRNRNGR